jgi:hypothetical protein
MSQRRALDQIHVLRTIIGQNMSIAHAVNDLNGLPGIDSRLKKIAAQLVDDSKPSPTQHQGSVWQQMQELYAIANQNGLYDAADYIMETCIRTKLGNCPHPFIWPDGECIACERLATTMPGHVEAHHKMIPRRPKQNVIEMYVCEINRLVLHTDQLYRFSVDPTCEACKAYVAAGNPVEASHA